MSAAQRAPNNSGESKSSSTPDNASSLPLPFLEAPSEAEIEHYYLGLRPTPRLVGRTSAGERPWAGIPNYGLEWSHPNYDPDPPECVVTPLGGRHRALAGIEGALPQITLALDGLPWTCIDLLRIGSSKLPMLERPVVVWVGVATKCDNGDPLAWTWGEVKLALRQVRDVLLRAELPEVECEIREADCVPLAGPPAGPPFFAPVLEETFTLEMDTKQGVSTALGQVLVPSHKKAAGTLGVYVRPKRQAAHTPIWALTCRHVCQPETEHTNDEYREMDPARQALSVFSPSDSVLKDKLGQVANILADGNLNPEQMAAARTTLGVLQNLHPWDNRKIGSVCLAPPIEPLTRPDSSKRWTRDWALVDLLPAKFPPAYTRNEVDLRSNPYPWFNVRYRLFDLLHELFHLSPAIQLPKSGVLPIRGVVPMAELEWVSSGKADGPAPFWFPAEDDPSDPAHARQAKEVQRLKDAPVMRDNNKGRVLVVGKMGNKTGLTWGLAAEFLSVTRNPLSGAFPSRELAIVSVASDKLSKAPFSKEGDSGAVVFDLTGRAVGMLTAGDAAAADVTYCSPMELVLANVSKELGEEVVLL